MLKLLHLILLFLVLCSVQASSETPEEYLENISRNYEKAQSRAARILLPLFYVNYTTGSFKPIEQYKETPAAEENYDFIIVGSGAAGAVLANRLSEIPHWKILLLEVGEEPHPITDIPLAAPSLQFTNYSWGYLAEQQPNFGLGLENGRVALPRGRGLGGSTIIDNMLYVRGNRLDYNLWSSMGNPGWSYEEVLPYFKKSENSQLSAESAQYHGKGGYLTTENVPYITQSGHAFVKAAQEFGLKYRDYNGKSQIGASYVQATMRNGRRCSVEKAYLRPIRTRGNLRIFTKSRAVKILIDPQTNKAFGVEYLRYGQSYVAKANKEVILSAGAFSSPQLLMLSGIGPKNHLEELGIQLIKDLPVGKKLQDHLVFDGLIFTVNDSSIVYPPRAVDDLLTYIEYIENSRGPLTTTSLIEGLAFLKTPVSKDTKSYPDVELMFFGGGLNTDSGAVFRKALKFTDRIYNTIFKPLENRGAFMIRPNLVHPKSHGFLKLKSKNPFHWPKIYPNYFTDAENSDARTLVAAIREVQKLVKTPTFQRYNAQQVTTKVPGCEHFVFDTDIYWECALRHLTTSMHHQVGTCKMGPSTDSEAVVDSRLRVHGLRNLRVVDSSVIHLPLTGHLSAPTIMLGEKAADLIKQEWNAGQITPQENVV